MATALSRITANISDLKKSAETAVSNAKTKPIVFIKLDEISTPCFQSRKYFDPEELSDLANSIKKNGVLQPILVRLNPSGKGYERIFGERRCRASVEAGLDSIPAQIADVDDTVAHQMCIDENAVRRDISTYEKSLGVVDLAAMLLGVAHDDVLQEFKNQRSKKNKEEATEAVLNSAIDTYFPRMKPKSFVNNILPLVKLDDETIILSLLRREIDPGSALLLTRLDKAILPDLLAKAKSGNITIKELREYLPIEKKIPSSSNPKNTSSSEEEDDDKATNTESSTTDTLNQLGDHISESNESKPPPANQLENTSDSKSKNKGKTRSKPEMDTIAEMLVEILSLSSGALWSTDSTQVAFNGLIQQAIKVFDANSSAETIDM
jgi:ParB/RepB/Spo0J family partition protein